MANKINSTLMTGMSQIQSALVGTITKLVEDNMTRILADLSKAATDIGSTGITLKVSTPISFTGTKVYMEPTIEWERKNKSKVDGKPVNIELLQSTLDLGDD